MPRKAWNGDDALYSDAVDVYFFNIDALCDYLTGNSATYEDLRLVICDPVYATGIDPMEYYCDDLPDDAELPEKLMKAFDVLNEAIGSRNLIAWKPGKTAPTPESVSIEYFRVLEIVREVKNG